MLKSITIENYKSIEKLSLELGRLTVIIGENGCGKSNIIEAIAFASAAATRKLDAEFLASRGVRVTNNAAFMRSGFSLSRTTEPITICMEGEGGAGYNCELQNDNTPYGKWRIGSAGMPATARTHELLTHLADSQTAAASEPDNGTSWILRKDKEVMDPFEFAFSENARVLGLDNYLIYSPENTTLRLFEREGQIQPLGINGEGLFKLLGVMQESEPAAFEALKMHLRLMGWFKDLRVPFDLFGPQRRLEILDKYVDESLSYFDQKSANEGFLLLTFYFSLFLSHLTPSFFAIDNIDASLNPRLCQKLVKELAVLARQQDKQAILTTHNPAVLDGLNLNDEEQQLWVVSRDRGGRTVANRVRKPALIEGQTPVKLSEAFLRGYIGGLPKGF